MRIKERTRRRARVESGEGEGEDARCSNLRAWIEAGQVNHMPYIPDMDDEIMNLGVSLR